MKRLYSYCEPSVDHEELLSIFGEKSGLVPWVDRNTWVVYITVVQLGTLEIWETNFTFSPSSLIGLPQLPGVGPCYLLRVTLCIAVTKRIAHRHECYEYWQSSSNNT